MTTYYEEHDLLPGRKVPLDRETARAHEAKLAEEIERELDHHVGRGAIRTRDRDRWRERLFEEPELGVEIIRDLAPSTSIADENWIADERLRALARANREFMAVEEDAREIGYEAVEEISASEAAYRQLRDALKPSGAR